MLPVTASSEELLAGQALPVMTNVMQFNHLANRPHRTTCAFHLEGVVRWAGPDKQLVVLEDDSSATIVEADAFDASVQSGQRVELDGNSSVSGSGDRIRIRSEARRGGEKRR